MNWLIWVIIEVKRGLRKHFLLVMGVRAGVAGGAERAHTIQHMRQQCLFDADLAGLLTVTLALLETCKSKE